MSQIKKSWFSLQFEAQTKCELKRPLSYLLSPGSHWVATTWLYNSELVERGMRVVFFPRLEEILDHISSLPPWKKNTIKDENLNQRKEKEIKKGQGKDLFKPLYL